MPLSRRAFQYCQIGWAAAEIRNPHHLPRNMRMPAILVGKALTSMQPQNWPRQAAALPGPAHWAGQTRTGIELEAASVS